jgi:hypothetical protein
MMMITRVTSIIIIETIHEMMYNIIFTDGHKSGFTQA